MATNKRTWTPQIVRDRIKVMQIVNRLQAFALGEQIGGHAVKMSTQQIRAAEILLRKTVPDLSAVSVTGEDGKPLQVNLVSFLNVKPEDVDPPANQKPEEATNDDH